jgi:nucleoside-diphosphate-sugar epimerase
MRVRVVVTGAAGFIGSHVSELLVETGHDVVGVDCFTPYYNRREKERNLTGLLDDPRFTFHELDLRVDALDGALAGADAVINEAATPGLVLSWTDFDEYLSCNVTALQRLIDACTAHGIGRVVQASTSSVYGAVADGDEDQPTRPVSPYGVTKLAAENLLLAHHATTGFPVTVLRYFSIFGPRQRPDMAYRIFCEQLVEGETITIFGDGRQSRANTYVTDCARATLAALEHGKPGEIYNIAGGEEIALRDALDVLADELGVEPAVTFADRRRGDQLRTAPVITKARDELGWSPATPVAQGLRSLARWVAASARP